MTKTTSGQNPANDLKFCAKRPVQPIEILLLRATWTNPVLKPLQKAAFRLHKGTSTGQKGRIFRNAPKRAQDGQKPTSAVTLDGPEMQTNIPKGSQKAS